MVGGISMSCGSCQYQEVFDENNDVVFQCDRDQCGECGDTLECCCKCAEQEESRIRSVVYQILREEKLI